MAKAVRYALSVTESPVSVRLPCTACACAPSTSRTQRFLGAKTAQSFGLEPCPSPRVCRVVSSFPLTPRVIFVLRRSRWPVALTQRRSASTAGKIEVTIGCAARAVGPAAVLRHRRFAASF